MNPIQIYNELAININGVILFIITIIPIIAFILALIQYRRQAMQKRAEFFYNMRRNFKNNPYFDHICGLLDRESQWFDPIFNNKLAGYVHKDIDKVKKIKLQDQSLTEINLYNGEDPQSVLREYSPDEKRNFLGFFEEIALLSNSGLIRKEVAHYMFGYYAIRCWQSKNFWYNMERDSPYWFLFRKFAIDMQEIEKNMPAPNRKLSLMQKITIKFKYRF